MSEVPTPPGADESVVDPDDVAGPTYTIDELAAHTGVPSRTIRFYQSSGTLQKPTKRGRIAYYGPEHVERLALIGQLKDRGLRIRAIRDVLEGIDKGELALDEWLGLEGELRSSWTDDAPQVLARDELEKLVGPHRPGVLAELVRHELVRPANGGSYLIPSPGLLRLALELEHAGIGLEVTASAMVRLRKHLERAATELADHVVKELGADSVAEDSVPRQTEAMRRLRPIAQEWVRIIFGREMQQALRTRLESGDATAAAKRRRKRRR